MPGSTYGDSEFQVRWRDREPEIEQMKSVGYVCEYPSFYYSCVRGRFECVGLHSRPQTSTLYTLRSVTPVRKRSRIRKIQCDTQHGPEPISLGTRFYSRCHRRHRDEFRLFSRATAPNFYRPHFDKTQKAREKGDVQYFRSWPLQV